MRIMIGLTLVLASMVFEAIIAFDPIDPNLPCKANQYCRDETCFGFQSVSQLDFTNCNFRTYKTRLSPSLILVFPDNTILNSETEIINGLTKTDDRYILGLENLKGIDLDFFAPLIKLQQLPYSYDEISTVPLMSGTLLYMFYYSTLGFYHKGEYLLTPEKCNRKTFEPLLNIHTGENMIGMWPTLGFRVNRNRGKMCKYVFQNLLLSELEISKYTFEFMDDDNSTASLDFKLMNLWLFTVDKLVLDNKTLPSYVFKNIRTLDIMGSTIFRIQEDLFKDYDRLSTIRFSENFNMVSFLHGPGGIAWIKYLKYNSPTYKLENLTQTERQNLQNINFANLQACLVMCESNAVYNSSLQFMPYYNYSFPDEDFCLYRDIPFQRLVFISTDREKSCTIVWLYRYQFMFPSIIFRGDINESSVLACNFTNRLKLCEIENITTLYQDNPYIITYTWVGVLNEAQVVLVDNARPVSCSLAILINLVVILTIGYNHKRRRKIQSQPKDKKEEIILLEQPLFKYILLNSILNCLFSLNYLFDSFILYIPTKSLDIYEYISQSHKNKTIAINVVGSILKLMSNFSFLQISINRYVMIGKDHPEWIVKLAQVAIKKFLLVSLVFSVLLSSVVYFQLIYFSFKSIGTAPNLADYLYLMWFVQSFGHTFQQMSLINIFTILHDLFSNFLFCVSFLIMDILTVKKLHDAFREKKKMIKKEELRNMRKSERRSVKMVVSNSLVRIPETITIIFYYVIMGKGITVVKSVCLTYSNCTVFVEIANVFYITSLCFYLFFYVKFNKKFKFSFYALVQLVFKCCHYKQPLQPVEVAQVKQ